MELEFASISIRGVIAESTSARPLDVLMRARNYIKSVGMMELTTWFSSKNISVTLETTSQLWNLDNGRL